MMKFKRPMEPSQAAVLGPYMGRYQEHLATGRYSKTPSMGYYACTAHFGRWLALEGLKPEDVDDALVRRFLTEHLPQCSCERTVYKRVVEHRAALGHLVAVLRAEGVVAAPPPDEVAQELARLDAKLIEVWGYAKGTRDHWGRIVRRLLRAEFGTGPIMIASLTPGAIRRFILADPSWSTKTIKVMASAVTCYLRYRELMGDDVRRLLAAVPRPANWRSTTLPETLTPAEVKELLGSFSQPHPSRRRGYAMVRCLVDLGLRSSEVIGLRLDHVDWQTGTVRIVGAKSRRADVLPLPTATGEAIVDYLLHERPRTANRAIFVRHVAPFDRPVGRRVVPRAVHYAYQRCGWDRSRVHLFRHTLASRLVSSGAPLKHVADVLRHRSVQTSASYIRIDADRLSAVALPWPGGVA
jgi:integrase/recombinase XerD